MQIIPVIDLKDGIVVHAKQGNRAEYAPIQSELCQSADIFDIVRAFLSFYRFQALYIADLNAVTRQGNNAGLLAKILESYPSITFWIDSGYPIPNDELLHFKNYTPVLGSESFNDSNVSDIKKFNKAFILSLDFASYGELGSKALFSNIEFWPDNIIIMSLPSVGSNRGPVFDKLAGYLKQYPKHNFIAAGGIRGLEDLIELERMGIRQVLVATALHTGKITHKEIACI